MQFFNSTDIKWKNNNLKPRAEVARTRGNVN